MRAAQDALHASKRKQLAARAAHKSIIFKIGAMRCAVLCVRNAVD